MRRFFCVVWFSFACLGAASAAPADGTWLKQGIDAYDRAFAARNGTADDVARATELLAFITGFVGVHRHNNLFALVIWSSMKKTTDSNGQVQLSEVDNAKVATAAAFTPLRALPDNLSPEQSIALLRKFLDANPQRWHEGAVVLTTAAFTEFAKRK